MSKRFSNIMLLGALSMMGSVIPSGFINSFDYDDRKIWWIINENIETEHYDFTPDCEEVFITCGMRCGSATFI